MHIEWIYHKKSSRRCGGFRHSQICSFRALEMCPSLPRSVPAPGTLSSDLNQGKGAARGQRALRLEAAQGRYPTVGPPGQNSTLTLNQQKLLLHHWSPCLFKTREESLSGSPLPLLHRGPPLTKSEMTAYQRKPRNPH